MRRKRRSSPQGDNNVLPFYGLQKDDVAAYLLSVKVAFEEDDDKFIHLIKLLKDYKAQKIAADDLAKEATILFEHHPELLLAFNAFLPEAEKVAVDVFLQPFEQECLEYITKLKKLPPDVQKPFFKIMNDYGQGQMSLHDLKKMVFALPFNDRNLLSEFNTIISCEGLRKARNKTHLEFKAPRRTVKRTKCNFPELVFNKEIAFFEKAKMQQKKKTLNDLFTCFDKYRQGRVVSCEFKHEVKNLCPALAEEANQLFVHEHPSYSMLRKKEKCTSYETNLAREVLNDHCGLIEYDLTEALSEIEEQEEPKKTNRRRESQERLQDQEQEQKSKQDQDMILSQDG